LNVVVGDILDQIRSYSPDADLDPVMSAYVLAAKAHQGQLRKSGEPYLTHPIAVAKILADLEMDVDTIATALLHDALEDHPLTKDELASEMGPVIAELVDGVTKIGKLKFRSREELAAENFRKMMLAMSRDLRVILVKLADRLHNMRTIGFHNEEKQKSIAQETLEIYVPIASRLGLETLRRQLEDICFRVLEPDAHTNITGFLEKTEVDRDAYVAHVVQMLQTTLSEGEMEAKVKGRAKSHYSIYKKTVQKGCQLREMNDLLAFRVLVEDVGDCYAVLGVVHALFPPMIDRIKDYVARPKRNGYQSLHTTVLGPQDRAIEVQIRTHEMDRVAECGIAAHWQYKEGHLALSPEDVEQVGRIREVFEAAREAESATEFMETVKFEFYSDEVFVFTPAGDVKRFPRGATALDFAYAVHTDVGNACVGAKVSGKLVPIRYVLQSGDQMEILTNASQTPRRDWLDIARTGRAIGKIRRYLREEEAEVGVRLGQEMVESELKRQGWSLARVKQEGRLEATLNTHEVKEIDALFVEVARGHLGVRNLCRELMPEGIYDHGQDTNALASLLKRIRPRSESPVLITGEDGVLVQFARCCSPLPGEDVAGFITRGRGISVHRVNCKQLLSMEASRRVAVAWDQRYQYQHSGEVEIYCDDRTGMLANITKVCERLKVNIERVEARNLTDHRAVCSLRIAVRHVDQLDNLLGTLAGLSGVDEVVRVGFYSGR